VKRSRRAALTVALLAAVTALGAPLYRGTGELPAAPAAFVCRGVAAVTAAALRLAGADVTRTGAILRHENGFAIEVTPACTGWFHAALYLAGLVAVRTHRRGRPAEAGGFARFAFAGVGILAVANLMRLFLLFVAGVVSLRAFEWGHRLGGEALLGATVLGLWWLAGSTRDPSRPFPPVERAATR
jgi:exosortase/archaeosortase family protein